MHTSLINTSLYVDREQEKDHNDVEGLMILHQHSLLKLSVIRAAMGYCGRHNCAHAHNVRGARKQITGPFQRNTCTRVLAPQVRRSNFVVNF